MKDKCRDHSENDEEKFFLIPVKSIKASCTSDKTLYNIENVLNTSYNNQWNCIKKGSHITLEPDYSVPYLKGKGLNQVHISFVKGMQIQYYFYIESSNDNINFTKLTGMLMSSAKTDALEPFYLPEEIKPKYIRITFNGNNVDDSSSIFTIQLVNAEIEPYGSSYVPNP